MRHWLPRTSMLLATALALLATMPSLALADTTTWSAVPAAVQSWPNVVNIAVTYTGRNPATGTVAVQAVVDGDVVTSYVAVSVLSGQTVVVPVAFTGAVVSLKSISAGGNSPTMVSAIGDDSNPF